MIPLSPQKQSSQALRFERTWETENEDWSLWVVHKLEAYQGATSVGYLKISYVPREKYDQFFANRWQELGHILHVSEWRRVTPQSPLDSLQRAIYMAVYKTQGYDAANSANRPSPETCGEAWAILETHYAANLKRAQEKLRQFKSFHINRPLVDFIEVNPEFRRQGIATRLYEEAARWMAENKMVLHASGIQTPEAAAVWERLAEQGKVRWVDTPNGMRRYHAPTPSLAAKMNPGYTATPSSGRSVRRTGP